MWSGRPISGPRSTHLEQGGCTGSEVPAAALVNKLHQILCAEQEERFLRSFRHSSASMPAVS